MELTKVSHWEEERYRDDESICELRYIQNQNIERTVYTDSSNIEVADLQRQNLPKTQPVKPYFC